MFREQPSLIIETRLSIFDNSGIRQKRKTDDNEVYNDYIGLPFSTYLLKKWLQFA